MASSERRSVSPFGAGPERELRVVVPEGRPALDVRATLGRFVNFKGVGVARLDLKPEPGPRASRWQALPAASEPCEPPDAGVAVHL